MTELPLECFRVAVTEHIAQVTLARPPVNAQNRRFREEIIAIFDELGERDDVRAIILTGEGKTFSAGADLKERPDPTVPGTYPRHGRLVRESFNAVMECAKPVIGAINGPAIGAGCVLALCCDILVAAEESFLAMTEVENALAGGVRHIRRHFHESDARLMIYTARRLAGPELKRMGVVSACVPGSDLLDTAMGIAREIASKSPAAIRAAKRSFTVTENLPLQDGYKFEQSQTQALASSDDFREAQRAFAEKRKPVF